MDPSSLARGRPNQPHYNYVHVGGANLYLTDCCTLTRINGKKGAKSEDMAVESTEVGADEGRCIEDGALYLVEDRLETFKESHWPFDSGPCTALKVRLLMMSSILISHVYNLEVFYHSTISGTIFHFMLYRVLPFIGGRSGLLLLWYSSNSRLGSLCCLSSRYGGLGARGQSLVSQFIIYTLRSMVQSHIY